MTPGTGKERSTTNDAANEVIGRIAEAIRADTDIPTTDWVAFSVVLWMGTEVPEVAIFRYDDRGEPSYVVFDPAPFRRSATELRAATQGERGELWTAAVVQYVERTGNLHGDFYYDDEAQPFRLGELDGDQTYAVAVAARPRSE